MVWSKWPWLQMMTSIPDRSTCSRRMFSATPSGLVPVSNKTVCRVPSLDTSTSTEKPCSATRASGTSPPSMVVAGRRPPANGSGRCAVPWSGIKASVTLSINVVTVTESTGSRSKTTLGSKSCNTWRPPGCVWAPAVPSLHMPVTLLEDQSPRHIAPSAGRSTLCGPSSAGYRATSGTHQSSSIKNDLSSKLGSSILNL